MQKKNTFFYNFLKTVKRNSIELNCSVLIILSDGDKVFHFCSSYPMPASTFALAVGTWSITEITNPSSVDNNLNLDRYDNDIPRCCNLRITY